MYEIMVWAGAAVSVAGLIGLMWSVVRVMQAKRQKLDDDALRAVVQKVLPYNLGALFLSVIGLMLVMLGLTLGG
ncbi:MULTISPECIES: hypothetical protein [Phaeobacter]|uniref:Uncharacterized protein n=1 Tax=Phaeobacter piscinae TaxID=1580596 RepID=A0AAN1GQ74_9RHOB|nr:MULTISPECIES: hypothetical protein [Phaeobacter]AFO87282.1 hypothetical protein PGA2_c12750 [Phaeobacter inhibens 2.10]ATG35349.1 hypothetical protein PhaeoP36_01196 [Phaeobacter piscinae]ATG39310.1 hypothetical protein PhaeoP14_01198 [Phaeobacter piscinae]ATG43152.1 hypothetical protein PhaeoP13_01204 [Phaeobacter piscinae]AUQ53960.1 hypothetical protein PhaeoP92_01273 [Phaeobacter inhibens]